MNQDAARITRLPVRAHDWKPSILVEPPAEIALEKMNYRATMLKPRDIFDITVVKKIDSDSLPRTQVQLLLRMTTYFAASIESASTT